MIVSTNNTYKLLQLQEILHCPFSPLWIVHLMPTKQLWRSSCPLVLAVWINELITRSLTDTTTTDWLNLKPPWMGPLRDKHPFHKANLTLPFLPPVDSTLNTYKTTIKEFMPISVSGMSQWADHWLIPPPLIGWTLNLPGQVPSETSIPSTKLYPNPWVTLRDQHPFRKSLFNLLLVESIKTMILCYGWFLQKNWWLFNFLRSHMVRAAYACHVFPHSGTLLLGKVRCTWKWVYCNITQVWLLKECVI